MTSDHDSGVGDDRIFGRDFSKFGGDRFREIRDAPERRIRVERIDDGIRGSDENGDRFLPPHGLEFLVDDHVERVVSVVFSDGFELALQRRRLESGRRIAVETQFVMIVCVCERFSRSSQRLKFRAYRGSDRLESHVIGMLRILNRRVRSE